MEASQLVEVSIIIHNGQFQDNPRLDIPHKERITDYPDRF